MKYDDYHDNESYLDEDEPSAPDPLVQPSPSGSVDGDDSVPVAQAWHPDEYSDD